ncbi:uncharacterized protein [Haliotis asinina]|uniref:uncharacterized protein n=1 Tax=Haliotis asinina TaxID=109174 RepID=UPI0035324145
MQRFLGSVLLTLLVGLAAAQNQSDPNGPDTRLALAALIIGIIACVGILFLGSALACYMRRIQHDGYGQHSNYGNSVSDRIDLMEKNPLPAAEVNDDARRQSTTLCEEANMCLGVGTLRQISLSLLHDMLLNLYNIHIKLECRTTQKFQSDRELAMTTAADNETVTKQLAQTLQLIFPNDSSKAETFMAIGEKILKDNTVRQLLDSTFRICRVCLGIVREWEAERELFVGVVPTEGPGYINFSVVDDINKVKLTWDENKFEKDFMNTTCKLAQALRDERRQPTPVEYIAFQLAYHCLAKGKQVTLKPHRSLGSPGFRPHTQTYMSLTDPGEGHVLGTTRFNEWMQGAIIHVEHLERPKHLPRKNIESYRISSLFNFSKVRLHVGQAAPTTYFVGRAMKDSSSGKFEEDFLKVVHMTSATISAAFYQGGAECKVAMEGLTTSQALRYMRALKAQVNRDRFNQYLSAAWNLNQVIVDDFEREHTIELKTRKEIALRAIEITSLGGFDKVTLDGASDTYPSKCIMYQMGFEEALTFNHEAHMRGLVTYFSAGFKFDEIKHAVYAGVDGIGIGGAQVLRYMDSDSGMHGPYTEENIPRILQSRDTAAKSVRGRGVHLLVRLDTMFFEGTISSVENGMREQLFNALLQQNEEEIRSIVTKLDYIMNIPCEFGLPLAGQAKRLTVAETPLLKECAESTYEWALFISRLRTQVSKMDEAALVEEYDGEPWHTYRKKYRDNIQRELLKGYTRQVSFQVQYKTTM